MLHELERKITSDCVYLWCFLLIFYFVLLRTGAHHTTYGSNSLQLTVHLTPYTLPT